MEPKKNPEADLEKKKNLFLQIGFIVALGIVILAFEWKSYDKSDYNLGDLKLDNTEEEIIPITKQEQPPPPPPPPPVTIVEIVKDDVEVEEEPEIAETEVTEETAIIPIEPRKEETPSEPEIFTIVERMPSFKGCEIQATEELRNNCTYQKIQQYLGKTIVYPPMAKESGITGTVYVTFVIDANGKVKDAKVLRGIGGGCDEEALRAVRAMPAWAAGQQRGRPVKVQYNLPVRFTLK